MANLYWGALSRITSSPLYNKIPKTLLTILKYCLKNKRIKGLKCSFSSIWYVNCLEEGFNFQVRVTIATAKTFQNFLRVVIIKFCYIYFWFIWCWISICYSNQWSNSKIPNRFSSFVFHRERIIRGNTFLFSTLSQLRWRRVCLILSILQFFRIFFLVYTKFLCYFITKGLYPITLIKHAKWVNASSKLGICLSPFYRINSNRWLLRELW